MESCAFWKRCWTYLRQRLLVWSLINACIEACYLIAFLCFHLKCLFEISPLRSWRIEACLVAVIKQVTPVGARVKRVCPPVIRLACLLASGCILLLSVDLLYIILYTWFTPRLSSALRGRVQKQRDGAQCKGAFTWDAFCLSFLFNYYHM